MLEKAGFRLDRCKGDHRQFKRGNLLYTISGGLGQDAKRYQEKDVAQLIKLPKNDQ